jgi:hypothetical protein
MGNGNDSLCFAYSAGLGDNDTLLFVFIGLM